MTDTHTTMLPLSRIRLDGGTQPRAMLDEATMTLLREEAKKERRSMAAMMKIIVIEWVEAKKKGEGRDG